MNLVISNKVLLNTSLSDKAIVTMLTINGLKSNFDTITLTTENISSILYNKIKCTRKETEGIRDSIKELIENNILTPLYSEKNWYTFHTTDLTTVEEPFTLITVDEFEQLKDRPRLLRYFLVVVSTINNVSKVGFNTIEQLAHKTRIKDAGTIINYNRTLVEMGLLYIYNQKQFINGQQTANTYGRTKDKDIIIKNAIEYYDIRNFATDRSMSASEKRSISANYNNYLKGRYKGDIFKLRADCKRYNELCGGRNMKDLSVFSEVKGIRASPFMVDLMERNGVDTSNFYVRGEYD